MSKRLVIFDLDGTLLDTIGDLARACNFVMQRHGYPQHSIERYRTLVGNGVSKLIERALPDEVRSAESAERLRPEFIDYYNRHISGHTLPYPGIPELLDTLSQRGIMTAVASNKYIEGTRKLIESFFPNVPFIAVLGQRDGVPVKPDPQIVSEILNKAGLSPLEALYVGDSGVDMQTAMNAGVESVGVGWGFRSKEELLENKACHIVDTAGEILNLV